MNSKWGHKLTGLAILLSLTLLMFFFSILFGIAQISWESISKAIYSFDGSREQLIIRTVRFPRAMIAVFVGSSMAVAGCMMQALTRNALAGPELFGINYGAALTSVIASFILGTTSLQLFAGSSIIGAAVAGSLVFLLSSTGRQPLTSMKLVLAGSTLNLLFASLTQGILILHEQSLDTLRFWLAGSLTGRSMDLFFQIMPILLIGLICSLLMGRQLNIMNLEKEVAQGLGQQLRGTRIVCILIIVLLTGGAVALAGPIGFIGLAVPHIARLLIGNNYVWIVPYTAVLGALLLLIADIGARFVLPHQEVPVGIVTAFFGAPFLMVLAQRKGGMK
ncbi:iron complex transport system permease protein [Paenibacillus shirakamiensis]|uniref:Iron complex transport system permease protein n=1 Tax=Paenibacillus shirakamiensis TaxID=1265935 RepID=A0ABS4JE27_9BACL|nr:iron ABC transporter permease [Paenibacillus shirakamiensis]MBP1999970.1 iron complex transport system permease protein [Paenibacillus shirakamiensis]